MFRTTIKGLLAQKRRMFTTALAVTLGVAFMTGTLVLTDTIGKTFDDLFGDVYENTDAVVRAEAAFEGPMSSGAQRGRVDESLVASLRGSAERPWWRVRSRAMPAWSARTARRSATPRWAPPRSGATGARPTSSTRSRCSPVNRPGRTTRW